jgi:hypothetical protein
MNKIIKISIIGTLAIAGVVLLAPVLHHVSALGLNDGLTAAKPDNVPTSDLGTMIGVIINIFLYILGAVSVIMLIYGGIRYTTSGGNSASITAAKNTIIYAIVGLVVAILAYAIVNFVVSSIK